MTQEDETNVLVALVCLHDQTPQLQKNASGKKKWKVSLIMDYLSNVPHVGLK